MKRCPTPPRVSPLSSSYHEKQAHKIVTIELARSKRSTSPSPSAVQTSRICIVYAACNTYQNRREAAGVPFFPPFFSSRQSYRLHCTRWTSVETHATAQHRAQNIGTKLSIDRTEYRSHRKDEFRVTVHHEERFLSTGRFHETRRHGRERLPIAPQLRRYRCDRDAPTCIGERIKKTVAHAIKRALYKEV